jgi:peptide deformylase
MGLLRILPYGHPFLRQRARPVGEITAEIQTLIDDMVETMISAPGIGLAANQVSCSPRLFVANPAPDHDPNQLVVLLNPELVEGYGLLEIEEGCLSIPTVYEGVRRYRRVLVRGIDRHGRPLEVEGRDLLARIFQHELDHLDGLLFIDRLSDAKRVLLRSKLRKTLPRR